MPTGKNLFENATLTLGSPVLDKYIINENATILFWSDNTKTTPGFTLTLGSPVLDKYIINENATILFWSDNTKTISKRHEDDKFDKELGFLFAYFYKKYKGSNASRKRVIDSINYKKIKTFLFEFYVNDSGKTSDQARSYLSNLKVEK